MEKLDIKQLHLTSADLKDKKVKVGGWVRSVRDSKNFGFVDLNDGTSFKGVQLVFTPEKCANYTEIAKLNAGSSIMCEGTLVLTPESKQPFEIQIKEVRLEGECASDYPMQKKRPSFEYLREIPHLRVRANTFNAVFRLRSVLSMAIHEFFQSQGFVYVHTPLLTGITCEGDDMFHVVTGSNSKEHDSYFNKKTLLSGSGQIHVEAFALAFRDVYTFGPTFRSEKSNTRTHASEFWMIEPEIAFADLEDDMNLIEDCIKFCIDYCMNNAKEEMEFFNKMIDTTLFDRLNQVLNSEFKKLEYTEAIELLKKAVNDGVKFENDNIEWGMDLESEHERYITEKVVNGPVFLINYPKEIKSFYMKNNADGKTVAACDLLVPGVGELVGGSQREDNYDVLEEKMVSSGLDMKDYGWYLDLRKYGGCSHAGFGIGFERLVMYISGMQNIRDVLPFPRTYKNLEF